MPCAVLGSCQLQLALPPVLLEWCVAGSAFPLSLPVQETCPLTPLPVLAFLTVVETVNAFPATALPRVSLPAFSVVGGGGGALAVIVLVVETVAPESSVTVSLAVYVPADLY